MSNPAIDRGTLTLKPFVKWAGGKRQLIGILLANIPNHYGKFWEPFIGGGALFFGLMPSKATISDINPELVNTYKIIKNNVEELIQCLMLHKNEPEYFYKIRAANPERLTGVERSSRFIYLNKTCYNGLYRENSKGQFNAPFGYYKNPNIVDAKNLRAVSTYLNSVEVEIYSQDYRIIVEKVNKGDFIYLDPPYYPLSATASFTKYSKGDFNRKNQEELADTFRWLDKIGCYVMLSNSNTDFIKSLYQGYNALEVEANRFINCKAEKRKKGHFEVLIKNW